MSLLIGWCYFHSLYGSAPPIPSISSRDDLITLAHRRLTLLDVETLQEIAGFNQNYLHLGGAPTETRSYIDMLERELERREGHKRD
jgi:hypothetical protein